METGIGCSALSRRRGARFRRCSERAEAFAPSTGTPLTASGGNVSLTHPLATSHAASHSHLPFMGRRRTSRRAHERPRRTRLGRSPSAPRLVRGAGAGPHLVGPRGWSCGKSERSAIRFRMLRQHPMIGLEGHAPAVNLEGDADAGVVHRPGIEVDEYDIRRARAFPDDRSAPMRRLGAYRGLRRDLHARPGSEPLVAANCAVSASLSSSSRSRRPRRRCPQRPPPARSIVRAALESSTWCGSTRGGGSGAEALTRPRYAEVDGLGRRTPSSSRRCRGPRPATGDHRIRGRTPARAWAAAGPGGSRRRRGASPPRRRGRPGPFRAASPPRPDHRRAPR